MGDNQKKLASEESDRLDLAKLSLLGAVVGPFVLMSVYLLASRGIWTASGGIGDVVAHLLTCGAGVASLWLSLLSLKGKIAVTVVYIPSMYWALYLYSLLFIGCVFDEWL